MLETNKFSKYILIFLGIIFIYNTFGYVVLYSPIKHFLKVTGQSLVVDKEIDSEELNNFILSLKDIEKNNLNFKWLDENEFEFNGMLYDVKTRSVKGDSLILTCHFDQNENIFDAIFSLLVQNNKKDSNKNQSGVTFFFGLYLDDFNNDFSNIDNSTKSSLAFSENENVLHNHLNDIPSPPPRLFS